MKVRDREKEKSLRKKEIDECQRLRKSFRKKEKDKEKEREREIGKGKGRMVEKATRV